ncbi:MAG: hypothetical protein PUF72_05420 [Clostridiales bacterium]|nr:hypothetical protein [Clostridiales bacterium]
MTIREIENLTYNDALKLAIETKEVKGHQIVFVDFGDTFGYSALVFKDGKHIYYANDYELHHGHMVKESGKKALRQWYIATLNNKLYTEAEMLEDIKSYDEYKQKEHFLRSYYIMRYDYISMFGIGEEAEIKKKRKQFPFSNPISFCYVADENIIKEQMTYLRHLQKSYNELKSNAETFREMISCELANHEACVTCDYKDALDALGLRFEDLTKAQQLIVKEELKKQIDEYCC